MKVLDLFSGIGGFSLGLERAGMQTAAFCELNPFCRSVLKKHWPNVPIFEDVTKLKASDINDQIDVIAGGFPCQDISTAGRGAGLSGSRSGLWFEYHRLINEIQPQFAIIENVSALRSRGLDEVLRSLAEIGYDAEWHCIPASAVGAPHRRDRIWIVAYPNDQHGWSKSSNIGGERTRPRDQFGGGSSNMAYPQREGEWRRRVQRPNEDIKALGNGAAEKSFRSSAVMANADRAYGEGRWLSSGAYAQYANTVSRGWWEVEPNVGRVADGVPNRVDRLRALGNAVVPQVPEMIGRAIMDAMK